MRALRAAPWAALLGILLLKGLTGLGWYQSRGEESNEISSQLLPGTPKATEGSSSRLYNRDPMPVALRPLTDQDLIRFHNWQPPPASSATPSQLLLRARILAVLGRNDLALDLLERVLSSPQNPSKDLRLLAKGLRFDLLGEVQEATDIYRALAVLFPDAFEIALLRVVAERRAGNPDRAKAALAGLRKSSSSSEGTIRLDVEEAQIAHIRDDYPSMLIAADRAVSLAKTTGHRYRHAQALLLSAAARQHLGENAEALSNLAKAVDLFNSVHVASGSAQARVLSAHLLFGQRRFGEALKVVTPAIEAHQHLSDPAGRARALLQVGRIQIGLGNLEQALIDVAAAEATYRSSGLEIGESAARSNRAQILIDLGRLEEAAALLEQSLRVYRRRKRAGNVSSAANNLAAVLSELGKLDEAEKFVDEAIEAGSSQAHPGFAWSQQTLASIALFRGELATAASKATLAHASFREHGRAMELGSLTFRVRVAIESGALGEAWSLLELTKESELDPVDSDQPAVDQMLIDLHLILAALRAEVALIRGWPEIVDHELARGHALAQRVENPRSLAIFARAKGLIEAWRGHSDLARKHLEASRHLFDASGRRAYSERVALEIAQLDVDRGEIARAKVAIKEIRHRSRLAGDRAAEAWSIAIEAAVALEEGDLSKALFLADSSLQLDPPPSGFVRARLKLLSTYALIALGEQDSARTMLESAESTSNGLDCRFQVAALEARAAMAQPSAQVPQIAKTAQERAVQCGYRLPATSTRAL